MRWAVETTQLIGKEEFVACLSCPTKGWNKHHQHDQRWHNTPERFQQRYGADARRRPLPSFPNAIRVPTDAAAFLTTKQLIADQSVAVVLGARFECDGYAATADVLCRREQGWGITSVRLKAYFDEQMLDELAYTAMVAGMCGVNINRICYQLL